MPYIFSVFHSDIVFVSFICFTTVCYLQIVYLCVCVYVVCSISHHILYATKFNIIISNVIFVQYRILSNENKETEKSVV